MISFDCFGTLVSADRPDDPAAAVAASLERRGHAVPDDWDAAYREPHLSAPDGAEVPLPVHVVAALESRRVAVESPDTVREAVLDAFDVPVEPRPGAAEAINAAAGRGPVGVLSNCSVHGLVERALDRAGLPPTDATVTSVGCGWRKPDPRAFEAAADRLGGRVRDLVHVGDDPATDGGATSAGATAVLLDDVPLRDLPARLEACRP